MKVLKEGSIPLPENWKVVVTCKKRRNPRPSDTEPCGAELEVTKDDLAIAYYFGTHFRHDYPIVICPLCGSPNTVKGVPQPIWDELVNDRTKMKAASFDGDDDRG